MIGIIWNIRGLGKIGRVPALLSRIRECNADFVGIIETKKSKFSVECPLLLVPPKS